jgi:hypothetical protein
MDSYISDAENEPIVFSPDQEAFGEQPNKFCTLYPLMTLYGKRLSADEDSFPGRGRVWWKVKPEQEAYIIPGSVWVGHLELATNYNPSNNQKDKFQVRMKDFQLGNNDLVEIIEIEEDDPNLDIIYRNEKIPFNMQPVKLVFLKGRKSVLGPLKAAWSTADRSLSFTVQNLSKPEVLRVPVKDFSKYVRTETFNYQSNQFHITARPTPISITLTNTSWIDFGKLRESGSIIVAVQDSVVINWAAKQAGLTNAQSKEVKTFISHVLDDPSSSAHAYFQRFLDLSRDVSKVISLGEDAAKALAATPAFSDLVRGHIENVSADKVKDEIRRREADILEGTAVAQRQKTVLENDIRKLQDEFETRSKSLEFELKETRDALIRGLEAKDKKLHEREKAVAEQEGKIAARLERLIQKYNSDAEQIGDDLYAQLPFLGRLGLGSAAAETKGCVTSTSPIKLSLPKYLQQKKDDRHTLSEKQFIDQFMRVVEQRGYVFSRDDLINFHVCMKIGGLTILAGPSGTGKSSLPRYYAESLGCSDEYLHIPVRPDWLDERDLVGAFNSLSKRFEPANSGLVDCLIAASEDERQKRGGIYLICFDEMNLARVEHYFAQFLSVSEKIPKERIVSLFSEGVSNEADPYSSYRLIPLNDNLRFVGTVNIDETTHFFSPKILDRSQVISFQCPKLETIGTEMRADEKLGGIIPVTTGTFSGWNDSNQDIDVVRSFLCEIDTILKVSRLGLTYRPFKRMINYVAAARGLFTDDQSLDIQLVQVVFPRLRSTAPQFDKTIDGLMKVISADRFPRSAELLQRIKDSGDEYEYFQLI